MAKVKPTPVFLMIGIALLALAIFAGKQALSFSWWEFASSALANAAFVLLTVVIVNYLWEMLGGEPLSNLVVQLHDSIQLLQDAYKTGVRRVIHPSGTFGDHGAWMARLKQAESQLDLMGYTLHVWSRGEGFEAEVVKLVQRGVDCRVLIMSTSNPNFSAVINDKLAGVTERSTLGEADGAEHLFQRIAGQVSGLKEKRGSFEVRRVIEGTILCQLCRTDNKMTVIPYLYSAVAARTPLLLAEGSDSGLFKVYADEFQALWDLNPAPGPAPIANPAATTVPVETRAT
jgi:hypothetical protein